MIPVKRKPFSNLRIAVVHDWLPLYGGAERVLEQILLLFPNADLYSLIDSVPENQRGFLQGKTPRTSIVQRLPFGKKYYRAYFPIMPLVIEQFDLSSYDIIISSSYSFAKGVITGPHQVHLCYCHSPIRYAWDLQHQYLAQSGLAAGLRSWLIRAMLHYIRLWDMRTSNGVDAFATNSHYVSRRVRKVYQRDAHVIYPPIEFSRFELTAEKSDYYVTVSRMVPYKRIDIVIAAFAEMPDRKLVVIGDGPDRARLEAKATANVTFLGSVSNDEVVDQISHARAFVFAAEEDFGIVTVEAQACGTPVVAFGRGGSAETVLDGTTGVLFHRQEAADLHRAIKRFETMSFDPVAIRAHAEQFSSARFRRAFLQWVTRAYLEEATRREISAPEFVLAAHAA